MADYPTTPDAASTPRVSLDPRLDERPDPLAVDYLLGVLQDIPRAELPDGRDRQLLVALIANGLIDNLYTPFGQTEHTIAWAHLPPHMDPRQRLADWLTKRRAGRILRRDLKWHDGPLMDGDLVDTYHYPAAPAVAQENDNQEAHDDCGE